MLSRGDVAQLDACLGWLLPRCAELGVEVVVARSFGEGEYPLLEQRYPAVLLMPAPERATESQLRIAGFSAADGDIVHLLDAGKAEEGAWLESLAPPMLAAETPPAG